MLGYSSAYCFSTYEMDNGLYIIGFLADGKAEHSDIGASLFQYEDGKYQLISQTIHKGQALEQDRIVQGMLNDPSNKYYDIVLSNNENLAEIRRTLGGKVTSEKVDRVNPSMTVIKLPEALSDTTYTFYDAAGKQIDGYIPTQQGGLTFFVKPDEPAQVIGDTAAAVWLKSFMEADVPAESRISDYTITKVNVIAGEPKAGIQWEDMAYQYVVQITYDITTATEEYFAPGDGVSGKGTFKVLFRELGVKVKSDDGGGKTIIAKG